MENKKLRIAIVVHGRFHGFDLARALLERGHEVVLFTNYPKWAVARFSFPIKGVKSFWIHGVLFRFFEFLHKTIGVALPEAWLNKLFGQWAARQLAKEYWDVIHPWSGISEELLRKLKKTSSLKLLMRGSSSIRTQRRLLMEEEKRVNRQLDRPSAWILSREEREYALADKVVVLSTFCQQSFIEEGFPAEKLCVLLSGVKNENFRPSISIIKTRCERILSNQPLHILYVGALMFRKGMWDSAKIVRNLQNQKFKFRFVGSVKSEVKKLVQNISNLAEFIPSQPQHTLPEWYAWGDVFIFPTIEEGAPVVLGQANASGLPILTTPNGSGPDFIREDENGWVLPIRNSEAFIERLLWCDAHRKELAGMVWKIYNNFQSRDWSEVAKDFEKICMKNLKKK